MNNQLLLFMLLTYSYVIYLVYTTYRISDSKSVSCVVGKDTCNTTILLFMLLMGFITILYECDRNCSKSLIFIIGLLLSIYGLIVYKNDTNIHYLFAAFSFAFITLFMTINALKFNSLFLYILLTIQLLFLLLCVLYIKKDIFFIETVLILNFAIYYLYLHLLSIES